MAFLGLLQLGLIISLCVYEFKYRSIAIILWGTLLLMFGLPHCIDTVFETGNYPNDVYNIASLFVILFCVTYFFTRYITKRKIDFYSSLKIDGDDNIDNDSKRYFVFIIFGLAIFIIYIIKNFGGIFITSWQLLHEQNRTGNIYESRDIIYLLYYFSGYFFIAFDGVLVYCLAKNKKIMSVLIIFANLVWIFVSRTRANMMPLIVCFIVFFILKNKRNDFKIIWRLGLLGFAGLVLVYIIQGIRLSGTLSSFFEEKMYVSVFQNSLSSLIGAGGSSTGELGLRDGFYYFIYHNNSFPGFGEMRSYIGLVLLPFPNFMTFGLKPEDFAITMGRAYSGNYKIDYFSMHPTLFGDCYANLGFMGFLISIFWAIFISFLDKKIHSAKNVNDRLLYWIAIASSLFLIGRGAVYYGCRFGFIAILLIWIMRIIHSKLLRYRLSIK